MSLSLRLALVVALVLAVVSGIWGIKKWGALEEQNRIALDDAKVARAQYDKQFQIASNLEKQLGQFQADNQKLKDDLDAEIAKNGVYRACRVPDDGVRLYNASLPGAAPAR